MRILNISILINCIALIILYLIFSFTWAKPRISEASEIRETSQIPKLTADDGIKKLDPHYCVCYGQESAPIKVVEFFSFQCPHCIRLFRKEFDQLRTDLIETGKVHFTFHPVPQDLSTVQAVICLEQLNEIEKRLFLEAMLEEGDPRDPELMSALMKAAMSVFKKPLPNLDNDDFLQNQTAFEDTFNFIKLQQVLAVPSVEINGRFFAVELPDYAFIKSFIVD